MSRNTTHRSSEVMFNGKLLTAFCDRFVVANATSRFGWFVAPCDGTIVQLDINCIVTPTHATNDLSLGTVADIDSVLDEFDVTNLATGYRSLIGETLGVGGLNVTKGEVYAWGWVGADTTGEIATLVTIEPR